MALPLWSWILATTATAAGVILILMGVLADRSGGRRRCPRCAYDMRGADGMRCPECGRLARSERELGRVPRRRRRLVAGVLITAVGIAAVLAGRSIATHGWRAHVPITAWVLAARVSDSPEPWREIAQRTRHAGARERELEGWRREWMARAGTDQLTSGDSTVRLEAVRAVVRAVTDAPDSGQRERRALLLEVALGDGDPKVASEAMTGWIRTADGAAVAAVVRSLFDEDPIPTVAHHALVVCAATHPEIEPSLPELMEQGGAARHAALAAAGAIGTQRVPTRDGAAVLIDAMDDPSTAWMAVAGLQSARPEALVAHADAIRAAIDRAERTDVGRRLDNALRSLRHRVDAAESSSPAQPPAAQP